ncbi:Magnesium transporter MRS2-2 [Camellia lanceoleosa]|uniref:Magnesium transporter MRS2-2 n=1 Tax=Camellia lanceoleosa TaxID=1840588 RepID=A0ACC0GRN5_9ERIC|nr:Magnesium transporter MRS2-2 [Camellia lanceoleosa]
MRGLLCWVATRDVVVCCNVEKKFCFIKQPNFKIFSGLINTPCLGEFNGVLRYLASDSRMVCLWDLQAGEWELVKMVPIDTIAKSLSDKYWMIDDFNNVRPLALQCSNPEMVFLAFPHKWIMSYNFVSEEAQQLELPVQRWLELLVQPHGYIVPVDPQVGPKKKTASSRSWILMDATGEGTVLDVDKYAIMHRVQIHARDLRILDPLLSYPSTILGREKAIVLNLEHIKAIITAEEVLLRDPLDDNVIPVVEELRRRLPPINAIREVQSDGKELGGQNEVDTGEEDESPFEFRALEVALEAICSFLAARTTELETAAYPALDELTSKVRTEKDISALD